MYKGLVHVRGGVALSQSMYAQRASQQVAVVYGNEGGASGVSRVELVEVRALRKLLVCAFVLLLLLEEEVAKEGQALRQGARHAERGGGVWKGEAHVARHNHR
jgi:hypothetical protein